LIGKAAFSANAISVSSLFRQTNRTNVNLFRPNHLSVSLKS
jgi:hypothetical protein